MHQIWCKPPPIPPIGRPMHYQSLNSCYLGSLKMKLFFSYLSFSYKALQRVGWNTLLASHGQLSWLHAFPNSCLLPEKQSAIQPAMMKANVTLARPGLTKYFRAAIRCLWWHGVTGRNSFGIISEVTFSGECNGNGEEKQCENTERRSRKAGWSLPSEA